MTTPADRVADFWATNRSAGHTGTRPTAWSTHPVLKAWIHRRVSGDPEISAVEWFKREYFPWPVPRVLSLGCGHGQFDRIALLLRIATHVTGLDVSPGAIAQAAEISRARGLADRTEYRVASLDELELPPHAYDAIFGISSIHHVRELEHLFAQCRHALKPGALLFLDEYVGPSRFLSAPAVYDIMNRILAVLPERYRQHLDADMLISHLAPLSAEHWERTDPSEAVRSAEILPALHTSFEIVAYRPYGGAIMHLLLSGLAGHFDEACEQDTMFLRLLATLEGVLEDHGVIGSDFAVVVARPKP